MSKFKNISVFLFIVTLVLSCRTVDFYVEQRANGLQKNIEIKRDELVGFEMSKDSSFYYYTGVRMSTDRENFGQYYYGKYKVENDTIIFINTAYNRDRNLKEMIRDGKSWLRIELYKVNHPFNETEKGYWIEKDVFVFNGKVYKKSKKATRIYWSMMKDLLRNK